MSATVAALEIRYVIYCDDVRLEFNGKSIFIGVYTDDIAVPSFPSPLNLTFWLDVVAHSASAHKLSISVKTSAADQEVVKLESTVKAPALNARSSISFGDVSFQLHAPDEIVVFYAVDDGPMIEAARKRVALMPSNQIG